MILERLRKGLLSTYLRRCMGELSMGALDPLDICETCEKLLEDWNKYFYSGMHFALGAPLEAVCTLWLNGSIVVRTLWIRVLGIQPFRQASFFSSSKTMNSKNTASFKQFGIVTSSYITIFPNMEAKCIFQTLLI